METTGLVLQLYREHYGSVPLSVTTQSPLDVAAALTEDGRTLTIGVVNPTLQALDLPLELQGAALRGQGPALADRRIRPAGLQRTGPATARSRSKRPRWPDPVEQLHVEPCSVTLFALPLAN